MATHCISLQAEYDVQLGVLLTAVPYWVCPLPGAGQKGLSAAAKGSDGRGPPTQLLSYLCKRCDGVTCLPDLVRSNLSTHIAKMSFLSHLPHLTSSCTVRLKSAKPRRRFTAIKCAAQEVPLHT